jgi:hypothetical protein
MKIQNMIITIILLLLAIIIVGWILTGGVRINEFERDRGCYKFHVQECLECQKQNLTYLLCSGFCVPPSEQDLDGKGCPVIHPSKDCFDLPQECNLP